MKKNWFIIALLCLSLWGGKAFPTEWQWSVPVTAVVSDETGGPPQAFLWVPPSCNRVKALVVGQHNMCEETLFENPLFRREIEEAGIALVWISPILDFPWDVTNGCNDALLEALDSLAEVSGYSELAYAPIVPLGHSAMATFPWNFAAWNPERTRNIDGIPGLMIEGEYEWWEARVRPALAFRMMYPQSCISFLCDAGRGHFDVSDRTARYIALFLKKALEWRLPEMSGDGPVKLKQVNPQDGWLAERWRRGDDIEGETRLPAPSRQPKRPRPAPYGAYKGDPHDAFWYFDREMAELTESIYRIYQCGLNI